MASAMKCDRCRTYYDKNKETEPGGVIITGMCYTDITGRKVNNKDLCDECLRKLKLFLVGAELEEL